LESTFKEAIGLTERVCCCCGKATRLLPQGFFQILEENFCKECTHYDKTKNHLWEDAECCRIEPFDACLILYLTGIDTEWDFEESEVKKE